MNVYHVRVRVRVRVRIRVRIRVYSTIVSKTHNHISILKAIAYYMLGLGLG